MPLKGSCHCGATQFEVREPPSSVTSCNCSFCAKRGALHAYYPVAEFKLLTARDRGPDLSVGPPCRPASPLRDLRLRHPFGVPQLRHRWGRLRQYKGGGERPAVRRRLRPSLGPARTL